MLGAVLHELSGGVNELIQARMLIPEVEVAAPVINANNAQMLSENHENILRALLQSSALMNTVVSKFDVDQYDLLRPIMSLRERLAEYGPILAKEANILKRHPTVGVLTNSIPQTAEIADELRIWIDQAIAALQE